MNRYGLSAARRAASLGALSTGLFAGGVDVWADAVWAPAKSSVPATTPAKRALWAAPPLPSICMLLPFVTRIL